MATAATSCLSPPPPPRSLLFSSARRHLNYSFLLPKPARFITSSVPTSSSPSSVITKEQEEQEAEAAGPEDAEPAVFNIDKTQFSGCKTCGKEEIEKGCNGEGRIQGGIATVPGFGWWPIKAYRPCPGLVASGGRYRRQGQSMDDVASGRGRRNQGKAKQSKQVGS